MPIIGARARSRFFQAWSPPRSIHSLFNHFVLPPILSALILVATLPPVLILVFDRSEKATRAWLGSEFDGEVEMLQGILSGGVADTNGRVPGEPDLPLPRRDRGGHALPSAWIAAVDSREKPPDGPERPASHESRRRCGREPQGTLVP